MMLENPISDKSLQSAKENDSLHANTNSELDVVVTDLLIDNSRMKELSVVENKCKIADDISNMYQPQGIGNASAVKLGAIPSTAVTAALKKNPRDAASPRRSRTRNSKPMSFKEFDCPVYAPGSNSGSSLPPLDSQSTQSWKSAASSSMHGSIGGLAYVETPANVQQSFEYRHSNVSVGSKSSGTSRGSRSLSIAARSTSKFTASGQSRKKRQNLHEPLQEEQILFEQRLCQDEVGIIVRKIHSNGKSQLRYVKCIIIRTDKRKQRQSRNRSHRASQSVPANVGTASDSHISSSNRSVTSLIGRIARRTSSKASTTATTDSTTSPSADDSKVNIANQINNNNNNNLAHSKALTWGNKKKVSVPLYKFIAVRKGKTTDRTKRNVAPSSRLLSLVTSDKRNSSLDIEAPTKLDRDKFAKAFSVFLNVPLEEDLVGESVNVNREVRGSSTSVVNTSAAMGTTNPDSQSFDGSTIRTSSTCTTNTFVTPNNIAMGEVGLSHTIGLLPSMTPSPSSSKEDTNFILKGSAFDAKGTSLLNEKARNCTFTPLSKSSSSLSANDLLLKTGGPSDNNRKKQKTFDLKAMESNQTDPPPAEKDAQDSRSDVSSLTQGFNQEVVEELHQALNELRAELDSSRAEAARAVKVAEQAIQSAESCSSNDWNNTVTHKAAEAAAQAQKRSAEAIAKQRSAEEKLVAEKKSALFWRKQAEEAEVKVGVLRTRLAGAEEQRTVCTEELKSQKAKATSYVQILKRNFAEKEIIQRDTLVSVAEQNRLLEIELDGTRRDLVVKGEETKALHDSIMERDDGTDLSRVSNKKKFFGGRGKKSRGALLHHSYARSNSSMRNILGDHDELSPRQCEVFKSEELLKLQAEVVGTRKEFERMQRTTANELRQLPDQAMEWAKLAAKALNTSQVEVSTLKSRLALEVSYRRKLLSELQDLRGCVRVYCRPKPGMLRSVTKNGTLGAGCKSIISSPSNELALLHRDSSGDGVSNPSLGPMSFEFDRMFTDNTSQNEVYTEVEGLVLGALDGYNACFMAYGQTGAGKTRTLIGDFQIDMGNGKDPSPQVHLVENGVHLLAAQQLLRVAESRGKQWKHTISMSILEIHDEKLLDMVGSRDRIKTPFGKEHSTQTKKLEIRTNRDGDTIVQDLEAVPVNNFEDVVQIWKDALLARSKRLKNEQELRSHEASCSVIVTLEVKAIKMETEIGTIGRIQFVDLAGSNVIPRRSSSSNKCKPTITNDILAPVGNNHEWKFVHNSIRHLQDIIDARYQFSRSVPYRNSTLTHLLRDSLTSDTKVLLFVCVKSASKDLQETANSLRFGTKMRKVVIGKATKHSIS